MRDRDSAEMLIRLFNWIWCQPQTLIGWFMSRYRPRVPDGWTTRVHWDRKSGLSMGMWIFVHRSANIRVMIHEYGHSLQSLLLGPLYLLVIGVPSICWAWYYSRRKTKILATYYDFWTERWADKWAKIER